MSTQTVPAHFKTQFQDDIKCEYQQMGSLFRGLVRTNGAVDGEKTRFNVMGKMSAREKSRGGVIPISNPNLGYVDCVMRDTYIREHIDGLDLAKMSTDVRSGYVKNATGAFARKTDEHIITAMTDDATEAFGDFSLSYSENFMLQLGEEFDEANVPRDGRRFLAVTPRGWSHMMKIPEFKSADYVGGDLEYRKMGEKMKQWNGFNIFVSNLLRGRGTAQCTNLAWHSDSVGHGINAEVQTTWEWKGERWGWQLAGAMSMGACVIDNDGVRIVRVDDTLVLPS